MTKSFTYKNKHNVYKTKLNKSKKKLNKSKNKLKKKGGAQVKTQEPESKITLNGDEKKLVENIIKYMYLVDQGYETKMDDFLPKDPFNLSMNYDDIAEIFNECDNSIEMNVLKLLKNKEDPNIEAINTIEQIGNKKNENLVLPNNPNWINYFSKSTGAAAKSDDGAAAKSDDGDGAKSDDGDGTSPPPPPDAKDKDVEEPEQSPGWKTCIIPIARDGHCLYYSILLGSFWHKQEPGFNYIKFIEPWNKFKFVKDVTDKLNRNTDGKFRGYHQDKLFITRDGSQGTFSDIVDEFKTDMKKKWNEYEQRESEDAKRIKNIMHLLDSTIKKENFNDRIFEDGSVWGGPAEIYLTIFFYPHLTLIPAVGENALANTTWKDSINAIDIEFNKNVHKEETDKQIILWFHNQTDLDKYKTILVSDDDTNEGANHYDLIVRYRPRGGVEEQKTNT